MSAYSGCCERDGGIRRSKRCSRTELVRVCGDVQLAGWRVSGGRAPSGGERQRSESSEGATELGFPGPTLGQMQSEAARRAGEVRPWNRSGDAGSWWSICSSRMRAFQLGLGCVPSPAPPARRRWRPRPVRGDAFNPTPYARMAFSISAWRDGRVPGFPPLGDAAVIAVGGEEGQLGTGRGFHAPDDEPHRRGVGLTKGVYLVDRPRRRAPSIQ